LRSEVRWSSYEDHLTSLRKGGIVLYDADHNDCPPDPVPFWDEVERFLAWLAAAL